MIIFLILTRAVFVQVSKAIRDSIGFALLRSVFVPEKSHHSLNQSDAQLDNHDLMVSVFSRSEFSLSFHWLIEVFYFLLIGCCDYFSSTFTTLNRKAQW